MSLTDRDFGYRDLLFALDDIAEEPEVLVGIVGTAGGDLVEYATRNEFGIGPPERSFLRSTLDENQATYESALEKAITEGLDGKDMERALRRLGLRAVSDIQRKIVDLKTPPNAPSTIRQKGSSNPLIDTGRMRQSIASQVKMVGKGDGTDG